MTQTAKLHVGLPNIPDEKVFFRHVEGMLASRQLTNDGPLVRQLEERICGFLGTKHAVAVCNATLGLQVAAKALGLTGEVIMPSFTFVATAHALEWIGLKPVFVDISPADHNINPDKIQCAVTSRTSAILGVHVWGNPCHTSAIEALADERGLSVFYDASHAFGSSHTGRKIGNFGACEVFSFHSTKFVHTFEGGVVTTNNDELAQKMRLMRNFGFSGFDNVVSAGINAKMSEISAAMGLCCLQAMDEFAAANQRNYRAYRQGLESLPGISVLRYDESEFNNFQYVVMIVDPDECPCTRDEIVDALHAENIMARRYFWPGCHRMEPYRTLEPNGGQRLIHTERVAASVVILPTGPTIAAKSIARVCDVIKRKCRAF
jgi:dTDP-4-amino-4,6-dideoxygalactose transaminase